jgi:hypothetical protein
MPMPGALYHVCRFFGIKQAGVEKPTGVQPMALTDKKRFAELDALIRAGYGNMKQEDIPDEVMIALEEGQEIPIKGPDRDIRWARDIEAEPVPYVKRVRAPDKKKRVLTQEQRDRKNARNRSKWFYKYGPRPRPPVQQQEGTNADLEHIGSNTRNTYSAG